MITNIMVLVLGFMIILHKYYTDKEILQLKRKLKEESKVTAELIDTTREVLRMQNLTVNGMIRPMAHKLNELASKLESNREDKS